jgi:hypothetical protein
MVLSPALRTKLVIFQSCEEIGGLVEGVAFAHGTEVEDHVRRHAR